jgi:hypothetical protein
VALVGDDEVVPARQRIGYQLLLALLAEHGDNRDELISVAVEMPRCLLVRIIGEPLGRSTRSIRLLLLATRDRHGPHAWSHPSATTAMFCCWTWTAPQREQQQQ